MNQILDYNPNKNPGSGSSGSDKVVRVFAVILAIFALCLLGGGAYGLYKNSKNQSNISTNAATDAQITIEQKETTAIIKATHDKIIEKMIYSWDAEKETTIKGSGESTMKSEVSLFAGEHTLNVKVVDIEGHETLFEQVVTSEKGEDKIFPVIDLKVTDEKKLRITVTDETALAFFTYRWNDEEEQKIEVSEENQKEIVEEIEILKGDNDLTIVAVDKNNNSTTDTKSFSGLTKPDVTITISPDKKSAEVMCFHENGLKEIKVNINGQDFPLNIEDAPKEYGFNATFEEPTNDITVTATSIDDTKTEVTEHVESEEQPAENPTEDGDVVEFLIEKDANDETKAFLRAVCEAGIKEAKLNVNDVDYPIEISQEDPPKEISFPFNLVEGNNKFTFKVISVNGTEREEVKEITL